MKIEVKDIRDKIDFGIITIREDEYRAVYDRLKPLDSSIGGNRTYELGVINNIEENGHYRFALVRMAFQGEGTAQNVARDMIEDLRPNLLLLIGIGGAVPSSDFSLGDVVCATRVYDFSIRAVKEGAPDTFSTRGGPMHVVVEDILNRLPALERQLLNWNSRDSIGMTMPLLKIPKKGSKLYYGSEDWQEDVRKSLTNRLDIFGDRLPRVTARPVASSDTLIKDATLFSQWLTEARDVAAVEMELSGVYIAARRRDKEYPILAIRGISDIVGFKREEAWTKYACNSAGAFALAACRRSKHVNKLNSNVMLNWQLICSNRDQKA
jgi:nucleoside phosphorylase